MLEPLDRKGNSEGQDREGCCPDAEVTEPYCWIVDDLDYELGGEVGNDESEETLRKKSGQYGAC